MGVGRSGLTLWPHQDYGVGETFKRIDAGGNRICLTGSTGCGKTVMAVEMILEAIARGLKVVFYVHRSSLAEQTRKVFESFGIDVGMRASGYKPSFDKPVQISMVQTERARTLSKHPKWSIHHASLVIIDEVHGIKSETAQRLVDLHIAEGAAIVGLTATPLDIWHMFNDLVVAGRNSELRACGAHLWCKEYSPTMPDLLNMRLNSECEYSEKEVEKHMAVPQIFGNILSHFNKLNPQRVPTILFGPSVRACRFITDQLLSAGVSAAHIDAKEIYRGTILGVPQLEDSRKIQNRELLFNEVRNGHISVLVNRFLCVEGLDLPQVGHLIMASSFGSLKMFLQAGGRLLRNHDSLSSVTLQDHGGSVLLHGSLNEDRDWEIEQDSKYVRRERIRKIQEGELDEHIVCPKCGAMRLSGPKCFECGHQHTKSGRHVVQTDGTLKLQHGNLFKRKRKVPAAEKAWNSMYFPSSKSKGNRASTFNQLVARFRREYPEYHLHENTDQHGRRRLAAIESGDIVFLPNAPSVDNAHLMALKVRDVDRSHLLR